MGAVQLNAVKPPGPGSACRPAESGYNLSDFRRRQLGRFHRKLTGFHRRGRHRTPAGLLGIGLASGMHQLNRHAAAGFVYGLCQAPVIAGEIIAVDPHFAR